MAARCAAHDDGDVRVAEAKAVIGGDRCRLVRETGAVERGVEPVAGAIASEDAARAIAAVGGGRETDDEQACIRIAEAGNRAAPVRVIGEALRRLRASGFAAAHEALAPAACGDVGS